MFKQIDIETIQECNRRCGYCPNSTHYEQRTGGKPAVMPDETLTAIISELRDLRFVGKVNLNLYGEPLLDPRIISIVGRVAEIGAIPVIYTNGDKLDDGMAKSLKRVSHARAVVCVTDHNKDKNKKLEIMSSGYGFRYRHFSAGADVLHNRCGLVDHPLAKARAAACFPKTQHMYINANGQAQLCCNDYLAEVGYGDVAERGLIHIWNDSLYLAHRRRLPNLSLDICRKCNCTSRSYP